MSKTVNSAMDSGMINVSGRERITIIGLCLFLIISLAAVYGRTVYFDFVDFDDQIHVVNNPMVPGGFDMERH